MVTHTAPPPPRLLATSPWSAWSQIKAHSNAPTLVSKAKELVETRGLLQSHQGPQHTLRSSLFHRPEKCWTSWLRTQTPSYLTIGPNLPLLHLSTCISLAFFPNVFLQFFLHGAVLCIIQMRMISYPTVAAPIARFLSGKMLLKCITTKITDDQTLICLMKRKKTMLTNVTTDKH